MNTGIYSLGDIAITTAQTYIGEWITGFDGCRGISVDLLFQWGVSGTSGKLYLQTSLRQATLTTEAGIDLACMTFGQATKARIFDLAAGTSGILTPTDGSLPDDTVLSGVVLGDRFRIKVITVGTYASQTVMSTRIAAR